MRRSLLLLVAAMVLGTVGCGSSSTPTVEAPGVVQVSADEAEDLVATRAGDPGFTILDVRTPEEFATGHLEGAVNIDFSDPGFSEAIAALDRDVPYVLYCRTGNRSAEAAALMRELSFAEVYEISGGIVEWVGAGFPVVS